jgi:hypothetical protein
MPNCAYILKRGKNRGNPCNKKCTNKFCKAHTKIQTEGFEALPGDVIDIIVNKFLLTNPPIKTYLALACTSKSMYTLMNDELKYEQLFLQQKKGKPDPDLSFKDQIKLYGSIGCELCNKPRIRKVYSEYGVRCCTDCLYANTVNEYRLGEDYFIPKSLVRNCRYRTVDMYNPYSRAYSRDYTTNFYWTPDVVEAIGCSLDEYKYRKTQEILRDKRNEMNLYIISKSNKLGISLADVERLSALIKDCKSGHVKTMEKYYTETRKLLIEERKKAFVMSQPDYASFPHKKAIERTPYYVNMGRRAKWTKDDWDNIKTEIAEVRERQSTAENILKMTQESSYVRFAHIQNLSFEQLENLPVTRCQREIKCAFCMSGRLFGWPGIVDHHLSVHKEIPMKFVR